MPLSSLELDVRGGDTSGNFFIVQDCIDYPESFVFPYEVENCSFKVCGELCWDFYGDCIESINCL